MPIQQWSDQIVVADLSDDPQFTDELSSLTDQLERDPPKDVVLDMQENYFNSSIRPKVQIDYNAMWVFNVQTCTLGIFDEDRMVEPVNLTVNVERSE